MSEAGLGPAESNGAGGGSRTPVASLENWSNGRYTTPAWYPRTDSNRRLSRPKRDALIH